MAEKVTAPDLSELNDRLREHEGLVTALQAGEVDAVVVLHEDSAKISRLRSDEPLYRTVIETLPQGVATVLSDGTIVYLNRHLAELIGSPSEKLLGQNLLSFVADGDRPRLTAMLQTALREPQEAGVSFQWIGGEAPTLVSAIRLPISGLDTIGLVIMDVRDQIARQAAEESSRAKDDLLALVSHEMRTPLTSIMGWIQLLQVQLADNADAQVALANLKGAVIAETKIVDDLLDLSRSEKGALSLAMQVFDLREPLRTATSFVDLQAQNKSIGLRVEFSEAALMVRGDPDRLRQVFVNLLSNAVKFTSKGFVSVRAVRQGSEAVIEVTDSGIGIMSEFLPFVFEPFRRSERAAGYPGLGIGLAVSRRLVEAHGGTITASSDGPNHGATFTVRLPLV